MQGLTEEQYLLQTFAESVPDRLEILQSLTIAHLVALTLILGGWASILISIWNSIKLKGLSILPSLCPALL